MDRVEGSQGGFLERPGDDEQGSIDRDEGDRVDDLAGPSQQVPRP